MSARAEFLTGKTWPLNVDAWGQIRDIVPHYGSYPSSGLQGHCLPMLRPSREGMLPTSHRLINGDARDLSFLDDESVHLVVTSPPIGI